MLRGRPPGETHRERDWCRVARRRGRGDTHQFEQLFGLVEEDVTAEFDAVDRWDQLLPTLESRTAADGLVVTISPRRGDVGWHRELTDLPRELVALPPASFTTIHPRQGEPEYDRQYLRIA